MKKSSNNIKYYEIPSIKDLAYKAGHFEMGEDYEGVEGLWVEDLIYLSLISKNKLSENLSETALVIKELFDLHIANPENDKLKYTLYDYILSTIINQSPENFIPIVKLVKPEYQKIILETDWFISRMKELDLRFD
jgi:hypothetical protein